MDKMEFKDLNTPDELRELPKTKIEVVSLGETTMMRITLQPGWKWSECVKPTVDTPSCQAAHTNYIISGRMLVAMDNGMQQEMGPGSVAVIPPGHDAWVLGDEPCIAIDFTAGQMYGKS